MCGVDEVRWNVAHQLVARRNFLTDRPADVARSNSAAPVTQENIFTEDDLREMVLRLAHGIRNPLATIQSSVQLLEHLRPPEADVAEFYDSIQNEVARIDRIVRDMQRYVRLDFGTVGSVAIDEAVSSVVEAESSAYGPDCPGITVAGGPQVTVLVDRGQLEVALGELINNALRFSPPVSTVCVGWHLLGEGLVAIDVEDEGDGVTNEMKDRIMRPFFSTSTHGTGLGLNITAKVGYIAGGDLTWSNRDDGGACFTLTLPRI